MCETCPVREACDGLSYENARAWALFQRTCTRFIGDLHLGATVIARATADDDAEEFTDLMARLSLIYDLYFPPRRPTDGA